jgi:glutamyl-tRNA synthetase
LQNLDDFNQTSIEKVFDEIVTGRSIKLGAIAQPVRVALTGSTVSPGIYELINILGRDVALERIAAGIRHIDSHLDG